MKYLIRRYNLNEVTKGVGNSKYILIPGFLVIRDIWSGYNYYKKGEDVWCNAAQLPRYMNKLKPDDYDQYYKDWYPAQYWYDTLILGIRYQFQRPHCEVCGKELPFYKACDGYRSYCGDGCFRTPGNSAKRKQARTISPIMSRLHADPNSIFNSDEYRLKKSESMSALWADPNSTFRSSEYWELRKSRWKDPNSGYNTKEHREYLRQRQIDRWADPNHVFNSPEFRAGLSERDRLRWADPNDTFNQSWYREKIGLITHNNWMNPESGYHSPECRKLRSDIMRSRWQDPNSVFNSPEFRQLLSDRARVVFKAMWDDPNSYVNSDEYRQYCSDRLKYVWSHPDEYPYFHEVMNKWNENGGTFGYMIRHPELYNGFHGYGHKGYYQSIKGGYCRYMSSYELKLIKDLDNDPEVLSFITQPLGIKYYRPGDEKSHRYYPDFLVTFVDGHKLLIEVKPEIFLDTELNQLKFAIGEKYANDHGWDWAVFTEVELGI